MDSLMADPSGGMADIESYLVSFNKEISDNAENTYMLSTGLDGSVAANSQSPVYTELGSTGYSMKTGVHDGQVENAYNHDNDQVMDTANSNNQLEDAGMPEYQTVTLVPSANSQGEVSYMLVVQQDENMTNGGADLSVFDFKEEGGRSSKRRQDADTNGTEQDMEHNEEDEEEDGYGQKFSSTIDSSALSQTRASGSTGQPFLRVSEPLMCNYCNYTSSKRFQLSRHMKSHSEERPHKCDICGRTFKTTTALTNHVNTHRGIKPNKCKECNAAFTTSGELIRHVRYMHTFEKPHKCNECDYASVELSKLKRHIRSHTGERPYQCPHCLYASPDTFKLKRHLRVHSGEKPYVCDICDMRFTQSNSLKSHKLIHTGQKPVFQCELCPTTCGRKTDLKNHVLKIHTSDKPLLCKKCGKSFPDRYTYKIHSRTHVGQKCFRCELCPYSAFLQRQLEVHILTHTGEKPYKCHKCNMSFRQKAMLRRHINLYHNNNQTTPLQRPKSYTCTECGKSFALRGNFVRHLSWHYPDDVEYQAALARLEDEDEEVEGGMEEGEMSEGGEDGGSGEDGYSMVGEEGALQDNENLYDESGHQYIHMTNDGETPRFVHSTSSRLVDGEGVEQDLERRGDDDESQQRVYLELGGRGNMNTLIRTSIIDDPEQQLSSAQVNEEYDEVENSLNSLIDAEDEELGQERRTVKKKKIIQEAKRAMKNMKKDLDEDYNPTPKRRGRPPKSPGAAKSPTKSPRGHKRKQSDVDPVESEHENEADLSTDAEVNDVQRDIKEEARSPGPKKSKRLSIKNSKYSDD